MRTTLCFVAVHVLLLATAAHADTIRGTVASSEAAWDGDVIVSHADVVDEAGVHRRVVQLGGSESELPTVLSWLDRAPRRSDGPPAPGEPQLATGPS